MWKVWILTSHVQNHFPCNSSIILGMRSKSQRQIWREGRVLQYFLFTAFQLLLYIPCCMWPCVVIEWHCSEDQGIPPSWHSIAVSGESFYNSLLSLFFHVEQCDTQSLPKHHTSSTSPFCWLMFKLWPKIHQWRRFSPACGHRPVGSMPGVHSILHMVSIQWVHVATTRCNFTQMKVFP